ncbi:hypothetical protein MKW92_040822, partial [Papaver armeniacum]
QESAVRCLGLGYSTKTIKWLKLNPEGDKPCARMYATASARSDGMFLLCGGRDTSGTPLSDAYGLLMHRNGQWEWTLAPGVSPSLGLRWCSVTCYRWCLRGGRAIDVLDTAAGVWLDRNGVVTSSRAKQAYASLPSCICICWGSTYIFGGLRGGEHSSIGIDIASTFNPRMPKASPPTPSPYPTNSDSGTGSPTNSDSRPASPTPLGTSSGSGHKETVGNFGWVGSAAIPGSV